MGRVSPVSVDSGFESSFPSSPDSSSTEVRNLLLNKSDVSPARSLSTEKECKLNESGSQLSVLNLVSSVNTRSEVLPDITTDLPDVVTDVGPEESGALLVNKQSLKIDCEEFLKKLQLSMPIVSMIKSSPSSEFTNDSCSKGSNSDNSLVNSAEPETLSDDEKTGCCKSATHSAVIKTEEVCEFPSTSAASSSSSYTPSAPQSLRDTEESDSFCLWDDCGQQFANEMDLFDHVMKVSV